MNDTQLGAKNSFVRNQRKVRKIGPTQRARGEKSGFKNEKLRRGKKIKKEFVNGPTAAV